MRRLLLSGLIVGIVAATCWAQVTPRPSVPALIHSIRIMGGMSWPIAKSGFIEYWHAGPAASVEATVNVSRILAFGVGVDAAAYWFSAGKFVAAHPGVPLHNQPIAHINVSVIGRLDPFPGKRFAPYLGVALGAGRISGASYEQIVGVDIVTYYSVPGMVRLSAGLTGGVELRVSRKLGLDVEVKGVHVFNDPNVGLTLTGRSGLRFIF